MRLLKDLLVEWGGDGGGGGGQLNTGCLYKTEDLLFLMDDFDRNVSCKF